MSSNTVSGKAPAIPSDVSGNQSGESNPVINAAWSIMKTVLSPLASLKLTVVLFALSIFIVLAGTLAQTEADIGVVIEKYFRTAFAWIDLQVFFPQSFFPNLPPIPGGFWFPGGWLIGAGLAVNLIAAHSVRFKIQAKGSRLLAGLAVIVVGLLLTWLVVASGSNESKVLEGAIIDYSTLWLLFQAALVVVWLAAVYAFVTLEKYRIVERSASAVVTVLLGGALGWLFYQGQSAQLGDSAMRILWQLAKAGLPAVVLLAGCLLVFKKRAGIVVLHFGVGLMMLNELLVGTTAVEGQMQIDEGQTVNFVQDIRTLELAVIDRSNPEHDNVVAIPKSILRQGKTIQHDDLPFDLNVVKYFQNSNLRRLEPDAENLATKGAGLKWTVEEVRPGTGTDTEGKVDLSAAYIDFTEKGTPSNSYGVHLLGLVMAAQNFAEAVEVDGKTYDVYLRFKRTYKPYSMTLIDVRKDDYMGTDTAMNYQSDVHLVDDTRNVNRDVKIWMNNPLRFAGETFYQSSYFVDPKTGAESTTLSVVTNDGWMIPYVSCVIVGVGMLAQFFLALWRFLSRRELAPAETFEITENSKQNEKKKNRRAGRDGNDGSNRRLVDVVVPVVLVVMCAAWIGSKARPPKEPDSAMNIYEFGKLPIVYEGRVKPFDTLARNSLKIISDRQTFVDESKKSQPAIRWLLDVISGADAAEDHQVFRIQNLEVLETLGLQRRKGFRYAVGEFRENFEEFEKQAKLADSLPTEQLSVYQRKVLELDTRIRKFTLLRAAFRPPHLPPLPTEEEFQKDRSAAMQRLAALRVFLVDMPKKLAKMKPPLSVPMQAEKEKGEADADAEEHDWQPYSTAWTKAYFQSRLLGQDPDPATVSMNAMLVAYAQGEVKTFNSELAKYQKLLRAEAPANVNFAKADFEAFFNHFEPFYYASVLYVFAFVLAACAWLGWSKPLNRASFWLIVFTLLLHTFAMIARIYISGRPPVTNLYSSAVFIGWGCVVLGIILELIFRIGVGNIVAAVTGFATLLVAHLLSGDGDTFVVLQAVLDTQFWLATHVTCITLGYATTFLAGMLGIVYVLRGVLTPSLTTDVRKDLGRMIYGTLCFAILFSFIGTVLGGLWADDSWGRFWGWDPKENGALIIVLWNALVLHARWGAMVKDRGMAVLSVGGNIVTSWSWFGVNELGVGLHSYGFTDGVLLTLGLFGASQLVIIILGSLPKEMWWSFRKV